MFLSLALAAGFTIYRYYHQFYAKPEALFEHLVDVSKQREALRITDLDLALLKLEAQSVIRNDLIEDLSASDLPDAEVHADLMLAQAVSFLEEDEALLAWLDEYLSGMTFNSPQNYEDDAGRKVLQDDMACLVIDRIEGHWQLVSVTDCRR